MIELQELNALIYVLSTSGKDELYKASIKDAMKTAHSDSRWVYAFELFLEQTYKGKWSKYNGIQISVKRAIKKLEQLKRIGVLGFVFNTLQQGSKEKFEEKFKGSRDEYKRQFFKYQRRDLDSFDKTK